MAVMRKTGRLRALGVYIFVGGFTVGVRKHFDVLAHLEDGPFGVAAARENFPGMEITDDPAEWRPARFRGKVDFVYCNPPCAPWSQAGKKRHQEDSRTSCVERCYEVLEASRPAIFALESVRGLYTKSKDILDDVAGRAAKLGYKCTHLLTSAANHGVPQDRRRYMLLLHRVELDWEPTGERVKDCREALARVKQIGPYAEIEPNWKALQKKCRPGEKLRDRFDKDMFGGPYEKVAANSIKDPAAKMRTERGTIKGRPGFLRKKLNPDALCQTLTGSATVTHWEHERYLSVNEYKALCGYQQGFVTSSSKNEAYAELCKAVMPPVGEHVAEVVAKAIRRGRLVKDTRQVEVEVTSEDVITKELNDAADE